ncbi:hypothetical protein EDD21DRAFT_377295 [Dissophora ornata]|nr:hypothetical protein EDD21DRAFT_377295 [Dissophora ornata]
MATYIAHHGYDAEKEDELSLEIGDVISVSDMSDPGWWVGERVKDGKAGWFPSNFVDPYEEPTEAAAAPTDSHAEPSEGAAPAAAAEESAPPAPKNEGPMLARVEYDYEAKEPGELSLEAGRVVTVLDSSDAAWWKGDLNGKIGTFPSNYVKLIEKKEEEATGDKPTKFKLAAFGVKQGGLGSLFAGGVVPGLKKTGGLKKLGAVDSSAPAPAPAPAAAPAPVAASVVPPGIMSKKNSMDEPRPPAFSIPPSKSTPPVTEATIAPTPVRAAPPPPPPAVETAAPPEPRVPSRAKKPKAKQIKALVMYEYTAQEDDEISLTKGSTVVVTDKIGDEGWWAGRNDQGEVGNFPSDFVQEIKEEDIQSPSIAPASPAPVVAAVAQDEPPKSPVHSRPPVHAAVALPAIPSEPLRLEPVRNKTNEPPMASPPPVPRGSRPPSMIISPTPSAAQLHDIRPVADGPPLPGSPPPKRMSMASRSNSLDYPGSSPASPTTATAGQSILGNLSRSNSTTRRPHKPIPEAPLQEIDETGAQELVSSQGEAPTVSHSNRNSYILPTPVSRNRPLPPLARPPSIHQVTENRKSVVLPPSAHLPTVPSEPEQSVPEEPEVEEDVAAEDVEAHQEHAEVAPHVASPEVIHTEAEEHRQEAEVHAEEEEEEEEEEHVHEEPIVVEAEEHVEEHNEQEQSHEDTEAVPVAAAVEEEAAAEEKEPEKPKLPEMESSGPVLNFASRPRPAKGRKPPSAPVPNPEASFVSQLEAEVKAAPIVEEKKPEPVAPVVERAAPPPKPVKPLFQKFPTPFAGAQPASITLRPTGRRTGSSNDSPLSPGSSGETSSHASAAGAGAAGATVTAPPTGGVKSLSSRFGQFQGVPASGNNSAVLDLEIAKLRRWMSEELDRVKKELADERESREKLQEEVNQLKAQLQG